MVNCPLCDSESLPIVYGYPVPELRDMADKGEIFLGGCVPFKGMPTRCCKKCRECF